MTAPLEDLLARLGKSPSDHALLGLETRVWARITSRAREMSPAALWGWRSAAAALLLTLGLVVGGATGAQAAADAGVFTTRAALAPSTLLGEAP